MCDNSQTAVATNEKYSISIAPASSDYTVLSVL